MTATFPNRSEWRWRWMVLPSWNVLHRVAELEEQWEEPPYEDERLPHGEGQTVCGRSGYLFMPGVFSRMGLRRCAHCCDRLGIPRGDGSPFNEGIEEPGCEGPEPEAKALGGLEVAKP